MKLVGSSKIWLVILGSILLCANVGLSVEVPIYYNHPKLLDCVVGGQCVEVRSGSIEKISTDGTHITVVSGLNNPSGIALDNAGNLYYGNVLEDHNISLFKRTPDGIVTNLGMVIDRSEYSMFIGEWGFDVAVSPFGDIYYNHPKLLECVVGGQCVEVRSGSIEKMNPDGTHSTIVSGLNNPSGIALDAAGNLYYGNVMEDHNISLFKRTPDGTVMSLGMVVDRSEYTMSIGEWGFDVAVSQSGDVYYNHPKLLKCIVGGQCVEVRLGSIEKISPDGTYSTVVSGLNYPSGIALDTTGNLYYGNVMDDHNISLLKLTPDGMVMNLGTVVDRTGYYMTIGEWGFDVAIPEPSTLFLLGLGSMALLRRRRA